jgi:D-alanyl-D-alanine carboxypeptidase
VIRAVRRPLLALAVAVIVVGSWLLSPLLGAPAATSPALPSPAATSPALPSPAAVASTVPVTPSRSSSPSTGPTPSTAAGVTPPASPASSANGSSPPRLGIPRATPILRAVLDARLERLRAKYGMPGISAAILFADGSTWRGTAGLADVATRRPVTSDTAFSAASVSKTFTAALILALAEDGRIGLDSKARTYLPGTAIDPAITVRQLLDHTSGLRDFFFHPRIDKALLAQPTRVWDAARSLRYIGKPFARPGVSWHYSNTNYLLLGMLAEAVGRASVADQLRDRFFEPLRLDHTYYQSVEAPQGPVAHGYRFAGPDPSLPAIDLSDGTRVVPFTSVVTAAGAAGSIATSAGDLVAWARALYGGDALDQASRDAMIADVARTTKYHPTVPYGLGVQAIPIDGHPTVGHSGRFLGARAAVRWLPDERISIAVMTNQSRSDPNIVLADLLALSLESHPLCVTCRAIN